MSKYFKQELISEIQTAMRRNKRMLQVEENKFITDREIINELKALYYNLERLEYLYFQLFPAKAKM